MGIFKPADPLEAARTSRDKLALRLSEAEVAVASRRQATKNHAKAGADEKVLDAAEASLRISEDRVKSLSAALAEANIELQHMQQEARTAADKIQRAATVVEIETIAEQFGTAITNLDSALANVSTQAEKIAAFIHDALGLQIFTSSARGEIRAAADMLQTLMRSHCVGVLNGSHAAELARPAVPAPKVMVTTPPTTQVFLTKNVSWSADGGLRLGKQWTDVTLPVDIAQRALRVKAAVPMNHELRGRQTGYASRMTLKPESCLNLDTDHAESDPRVTEPVMASPPVQFEKLDRGPARTFHVARNEPMPATATRNLKEE